ncbi:hypothetical protein Baya_11704 [Bagarius yarrelli]|uniref:Uncharacterized protein n=1 Tax=Bagarius yarrelli TaxID=175774 RepID=A0A556V1A5_BAGYA|nr:hypothetical protein Baya_11704 [Bagarius yarrelli]
MRPLRASRAVPHAQFDILVCTHSAKSHAELSPHIISAELKTLFLSQSLPQLFPVICQRVLQSCTMFNSSGDPPAQLDTSDC